MAGWETLSPERIPIASAVREMEGLRILLLSDLHLNPRHTTQALERLLTRIDDSGADLVAITGDLIDAPFSRVKPLLVSFARLRTPAFFVSGNHDLLYGGSRLGTYLEDLGIRTLENRWEPFEAPGGRILVAGLPDRFSRAFGRPRDPAGLVAKLACRTEPILFLAHQPKDYRHALACKSRLFLCGHTHGGQIWPFHWLVSLSQPFLEGLHRVGSMQLFVSRGAGTWGIHRRFRAPAQLPLLEFHALAAGQA